MPMSTPSGETSTKFDRETCEETKARLEAICNKIEQLEASINTTSETIAQRDYALKELIEKKYNNTYTDINVIRYIEKDTRSLLESLLVSKLFQFFNFFGQWFIYCEDGTVLANTDLNAQFGRRPFLTHLRIWLKVQSYKIRKWWGKRVHTISVDREKGGHKNNVRKRD